MPIISIDTTQVSVECVHGDGDKWDRVWAGLEAGTDGDKNAIDVSGCQVDPTHTESVARTWDCSTKQALAANGVHRYLVDTLAQINANWTAALTGEVEGDKPPGYTPTGTTLVLERGVGGEFPYDLAALVSRLGVAAAGKFVRDLSALSLFVTDDDDLAIETFGTDCYGVTAERDEIVARIKNRRDLLILL